MKDTVILFKGRPFDPESPDYVQAYWPPLTLISLAAPLREAGFNVVLLDHKDDVEANWAKTEEVLDRTLYIGISALTGFEIVDGLAFADRVRARRPDLPLVWGGWHASSLSDETLADPRVDVVVYGLGQKTSVRMAQRLQRGIHHFSDLPFTKAKPEWDRDAAPQEPVIDPMDLSEVALPAYDMLDLDWMRQESIYNARKKVARDLPITGVINYVSSFGCPFHCTYCANPQVFGSRWGGYDPEKVATQIKWLNDRGFNWIEFIDAEFLARWHRLEELLKAIIASGANIRWASQATVKAILQLERRGLMPLVVESGAFSFNIGAESGSESVLRYVQKRQSVEEMLEVARILDRYGLEASFNCLVGLPKGETFEDIFETFRLAYKLKQSNPNVTFPISFYTPLPGSVMFKDSINAGFQPPATLEGWGHYQTTYRVQADNLPWRNPKLEALVYLVVTFYLPMAVPGDVQRGTIRNLRRHLQEHPLRWLIWIGHRLARMRMDRQFFSLPFEFKMFKLWQKIRGTQQYSPGMAVRK